jgi:hypothetical protein
LARRPCLRNLSRMIREGTTPPRSCSSTGFKHCSPTYRDRFSTRDVAPAVHALHPSAVLDVDVVQALPRWEGQRWLYPVSHLIRADLREVLRSLIPDEDDYKSLNDQYEYRTAVLARATQDLPVARRPAPGEYVGEWQWLADGRLRSEAAFVATAERADDTWAWWPYVGGRAGLPETVKSLRELLVRYQRW